MKLTVNTSRGTVLDNGATLLEVKGAGSMSHPDNGFIVLCLTAGRDGAEYVTWYADNLTDDSDGYQYTACSQGHYALGLADALADFANRS